MAILPEFLGVYEVLNKLSDKDLEILAKARGVVFGRGRDLDVRTLMLCFYGVNFNYTPKRTEDED